MCVWWRQQALQKKNAQNYVDEHRAKLSQPIPRNRFYGERAFSVSAPRFWNSLPLELSLNRSYSRLRLNLKTNPFNEYYIKKKI